MVNLLTIDNAGDNKQYEREVYQLSKRFVDFLVMDK